MSDISKPRAVIQAEKKANLVTIFISKPRVGAHVRTVGAVHVVAPAVPVAFDQRRRDAVGQRTVAHFTVAAVKLARGDVAREVARPVVDPRVRAPGVALRHVPRQVHLSKMTSKTTSQVQKQPENGKTFYINTLFTNIEKCHTSLQIKFYG